MSKRNWVKGCALAPCVPIRIVCYHKYTWGSVIFNPKMAENDLSWKTPQTRVFSERVQKTTFWMNTTVYRVFGMATDVKKYKRVNHKTVIHRPCSARNSHPEFGMGCLNRDRHVIDYTKYLTG